MYRSVQTRLLRERSLEELVVARKHGDVYAIYSYRFPAGPMGIRVVDKSITDKEEVLHAYKLYLESKDKLR